MIAVDLKNRSLKKYGIPTLFQGSSAMKTVTIFNLRSTDNKIYMKKATLLLALIFFVNLSFAQQKWFTLYTDSTALVKDANDITSLFISDIQKIKSDIPLDIKTILNTSPYLIYYENKTVNLPLWSQVITEQKSFFYDVAGSEADGKNVFGLFFNGFYLPHELGHGLQHSVEKSLKGSYENEYFANTVAILWYRKHGRIPELKDCYNYAKKIWAKLPNPVPQGMTIEAYFSKNYEQASENPYTYGYMQFKQFIDIYEDVSLPDFDAFMQNYLRKK